ncbi:DMT family transporter [Candidatus Saccharibacteria bacterium]|nr:DMT family transporter [Candidatus Saccharibacteria bacterium]
MKKLGEKTNKKSKWFMLGLLAVFISAPNPMLTRVALSGDASTNSLTLILVKYTILLTVFFVPLYRFVRAKNSIFRAALKNLVIYAVCTAVSTYLWMAAIEQSNASYASIINLLSPIILVILSAKLVKDRITRRATAGIVLAAIGGILIVILPTILQGSVMSNFYPLATILLLLVCVLTPLNIIYQRRTNEQGVPFTVSTGFMTLLTVPLIATIYILTRGGTVMIETISSLPWQVWLVAIYSALMVTYVSRSLAIKSYEYTGAAVKGSLSYLETLMAITLPLIILGEQLSIEIVAGMMLILVGVFLAESGGKHHLLKLGFTGHPHLLHHHGRIR